MISKSEARNFSGKGFGKGGKGSSKDRADVVPMDISEEADKKVPNDGNATASPNWWKDMRDSSNRQDEGRGKGKGTKGCSADHKVVPQGSKLAADDHDFYTLSTI